MSTGGSFNISDQNALIALVYETVLEPSLWPKLLENIGRYLNTHHLSANDAAMTPDGHAHDILQSHFDRAVNIREKITRLESIAHAFNHILNRLPIGAILVRKDATIIASNHLAAKVLAETGHVQIRHEKLQTDSLARTKQLHAIIQEACFAQTDGPLTMNVMDQTGEAISIWVIALSSIHDSLYSSEDLAAVFVHSPNLQRQIPLTEFARKHHLSRAETRLAETMLNGCHTLNDAADRLGLSKHTVRTQMKSILGKTGANSQIELIKRMLTSPSALISRQPAIEAATGACLSQGDPPINFRIMPLNDGRRLAWNEFGDPEGSPVMVFHCLTDAYPDYSIAEAMGLRMIVPERPGAHGSDPLPGRTFLDWPDDVRQLANHLRIDSFALIGLSAGTPYALACASRIQKRINRLQLVSCMAPVRSEQDLEGMLPLNHTIMRMAYQSPELLADFMDVFLKDVARNSESYFKSLADHQPAGDIAVLKNRETQEHFLQTYQLAARENPRHLCEEILLCASDWSTYPNSYTGPVSIWHGQEDPLIPIAMGQRIAAMMPNARVHFIEGEGNYLFYTHWKDILQELV